MKKYPRIRQKNQIRQKYHLVGLKEQINKKTEVKNIGDCPFKQLYISLVDCVYNTVTIAAEIYRNNII